VTLDVAVLHDAALAALKTTTNLTVLDGSVDDAGQPGVVMDPDGRAHMYAVLYFSPGWLTSDRAVGAPSTLAGSFQVTCAGGDVRRALTAATKVRAVLTGARLTPTSGLTSEATDPGSVREDPTVTPSRWFVPVLFDVFNV
jgi:hypothetical protein